VKSTGEALEFLRSRSTPPTVIISDMARREGLTYHPAAGLDLVREVRARKLNTPIYIYTASPVDRYRPSVEEVGGNGITASPIELFRLLTSSAG
jgi:CheY-like chemotaxis protein